MPSMLDPSYDVLTLLHENFDLTLKSLRITVKKGYLVKFCQDLVQSFLEMLNATPKKSYISRWKIILRVAW